MSLLAESVDMATYVSMVFGCAGSTTPSAWRFHLRLRAARVRQVQGDAVLRRLISHILFDGIESGDAFYGYLGDGRSIAFEDIAIVTCVIPCVTSRRREQPSTY